LKKSYREALSPAPAVGFADGGVSPGDGRIAGVFGAVTPLAVSVERKEERLEGPLGGAPEGGVAITDRTE